ncbi:MAG TPA: hypothetical protein VF193_13395 [Steroidobacter sp.]
MTSAAAVARQKTREALNGLRFPHNVFSSSWDAYLFFDSDWIFEASFVESIKALLALEGAACACLEYLDTPSGDDAVSIDRTTDPSVYKAKLQGTSPGRGWLHEFGRFVCTSDLSNWFIYCERAAEIAVIAIRGRLSPELCANVLSDTGCVDIETALRDEISWGFSPAGLSKEWAAQLLREYKNR